CAGLQVTKSASFSCVSQLVGLLLIGVAAWGKSYGIVSSINIIGGVIAVGVFLLLIAVVGLIGAFNHHQVMLFFYMVILFLVFVMQFGVSCSCLAINRSQQEHLLKLAWNRLSNRTRMDLEQQMNCCGFMNDTDNTATFALDYHMCTLPCKTTRCQTCGDVMLQHSGEALRILGGVGLFFSFTEILGVWLAVRYRNQKDPRANPSAFL
uniref:Tetraspanin 31 n=1 Tax=Callorhinchus milii TaxID=7868 RepID=A0A4W3GK72_CALMI